MDGEIKTEIQQNIQWHPAFVSAMNLELAADRENLTFEREYNLNTKPLQIDLLIIKKGKNVRIHNEVGHFFREYNILEYKAPGDRLDVDVYYKTAAYGCLYKAYAQTADGRKAGDITLTLLRDARPEGLLRYFAKAGTVIENPYRGIYYLGGKEILFPAQIIVTRELAEENHAFLRVLTEKPQEKDISRFLDVIRNLDGKADRESAKSILEVFTAANRKWVEQWKGEGDMGSVLLEIMAPELQEAEDRGREEGIREGKREGILGTVSVLRNLGLGGTEIKEAVMKQFGLSENEAANFL